MENYKFAKTLFITLLIALFHALPCPAVEEAINLSEFNIEADSYTKNQQLNEITFSGNVKLTFPNVLIYGEKIIVTQNNNKPEKVFGVGNIIFKQEINNAIVIAYAECESINLYLKSGKISFHSPKSIIINGNKYIGSVINYDIIKEQVTGIIQ